MDNQNTYKAQQGLSSANVLILVLMDNQNTASGFSPKAELIVLILVLMDNQNTSFRSSRETYAWS